MKIVKNILQVLVITMMCKTAVYAAEPWVKARSSIEGIDVYTQELPGKKYKKAKSEGIIKAPFKNVVSVLMVIEEAHNWAHQVKEAKILETNNPSLELGYWHTGAPWPLADRDVVVKGTVSQNPSTLEVVFQVDSVENSERIVPLHPDRVRLAELHETIRVVPIDAQRTKVSFEVYIDPAGSVPASLVKSKQLDSPQYDLRGLRNLLETRGGINLRTLESSRFYQRYMPTIKWPIR